MTRNSFEAFSIPIKDLKKCNEDQWRDMFLHLFLLMQQTIFSVYQCNSYWNIQDRFLTDTCFCLWNSIDCKVQHTGGLEHLGNDARRGCAGARGMWRKKMNDVCVCVCVCVRLWVDVRAASVHALESRTSCGIVLSEARRM